MEEPGRLQSMGLLRVGHDWATSLQFSIRTNLHGNKTYLGGIPSVLLRKKPIWITKTFWGLPRHRLCIIRTTWHVLKAFSSSQSFWEIGIGRSGAHKAEELAQAHSTGHQTDPEFKPRNLASTLLFQNTLRKEYWKVFLSNMRANESIVLFHV